MNNDDSAPTTFIGPRPPLDVSLPWFEGARRDDASRPALTLSSLASPRGAAGDTPLGMGSGRLRDEGEIARGGMGAIHQLYDQELRRRVALKVLDSGLAADPEYARRFIDEARITGALAHPNIVPVHDLVVDENGRTCYTMKLVDGATLGELITAQRSQRDLERILQCLASVCDALAFAHGRGIIHRDLKPDNIMVGEFGEVYLMDWGCALTLDTAGVEGGELEPEGTVVGTAHYMAPEQARGEISRLGPHSDIFAIGAILYKALTGQAPYAGPTDEALASARRAEFTALDQIRSTTVKPPPMLSAIVKKAMAIEPAERHASAAALAEDLRDFLRGGNWFAMRVFAPGRFIVREGDWADAAYIITAGRCEVRRVDPEDPRRSLVLRILGEGDVFGEAAIFADAPRSASVVALDEVSAVVVDRASLEQLAESTYLGKFVKALADRFLEADTRLQQTASAPKE